MRRCTPFLLIALASCAAPPSGGWQVASFGTMREVLREGDSAARVELVDVVGRTTIGVGAMRDLAGEVTVVDGRVSIAEADGAGGVRSRRAVRGDAAALLVVADVEAWDSVPIGACASYGDLERRVGEAVRARGIDPKRPCPLRVRGRAVSLRLHVIAGACPLANPSGPSPWRFEGAAESVELVGVYVEGAAGRFTHHDRVSHLHAVAGDVSGHLDDVALEHAVLWLPVGDERQRPPRR